MIATWGLDPCRVANRKTCKRTTVLIELDSDDGTSAIEEESGKELSHEHKKRIRWITSTLADNVEPLQETGQLTKSVDVFL